MSDPTGPVLLAYMGLRVAAHVADHWIQTECQALGKNKEGWAGRLACGRHVGTYVATQGGVVASLLVLVGSSGGHWWGLLWGLLLSAVTHYIADRRTPLEKLASLAGKSGFYKRGEGVGGGAYVLDQSWHHWWEAVAAVLIGLN